MPVAHLDLDEALERALNEVQNQHQLLRGLEQAEASLKSEQKGLDVRARRSGNPPAKRTSRLLILGEDGTERFYRQAEALLVRYEDRLMGMVVRSPAGQLARRLYGEGALVKAVLVSDREGVVRLLASLLPEG